jgi:hypothetical protein
MFIIRVESVHDRWIGGVFFHRDSLEEYLSSILDGEYWKQYVVELDGLSYPLYICEDHQGFRFLSEEAIIDELAEYAHELWRDDESWCYTNIYRIDKDWSPKHPGDDPMGQLPHHHVTNSILEWIERDGFQSLWSRDPKGAD